MPRCAMMLGITAMLASSGPLVGQTPRDVITKLFTFGTCGQPLCLDLPSNPQTDTIHAGHFIPALETSGGTVISFIGSAIGFSVSNTLVSSSSGGSTFRFEGGVPVKTSTSAGPVFGERVQTLGRGHWFVGMGLTQVTYARLRGIPLDKIVFNFAHENRPPYDTLGLPPLERDYIQMHLSMEANILVAALSATYGIANGVDLGLTIPLVRTSVSGSSTAQIFLVGGDTLHRFSGTGANPVLTASSSAAGIASGLGDVEARLKIRLTQSDRFGVAVLGSARFATGDENNLLGAGAFSGRGLGVVSAQFRDFSPHGYIGYTVRGGSLQNNSVEANVGFDNLVAPWATMAVDLLGSWQTGASKIDVPQPLEYTQPYRYTLEVTNIPSRRDDFMSFSVGFKFRTRRGIQIVTNALFPLRDAGLQPNVQLTGGLEYSF